MDKNEMLSDILEIAPDVVEDPKNTMEVANMIAAIARLENEQLVYQKAKQEAMDFYTRKQIRLDDQILFLKGAISGYMRYAGHQKVVTHKGTAFFANRTKKVWPSDHELLVWAQNEQPKSEATLVKTSEAPDKTAILAYMKTHEGVSPPGFEEVPDTSLQIRAIGAETEEV